MKRLLNFIMWLAMVATSLVFIGAYSRVDLVGGTGEFLLKADMVLFLAWVLLTYSVYFNYSKLKTVYGRIKAFCLRQPNGRIFRVSVIALIIVFCLVDFMFGLSYTKRQELVTKNYLEMDNRLKKVETSLGANKLLCDENNTIAKVRDVTVRIIGGEAEGSGVAIDPHLIVTNYHVIQYEPAPKIVFPDNTFEMGKIVMADKDADIALLKVDRYLATINTKSPSTLKAGEELLAIGYPFGGDLQGEATVKKGIYSGKREDRVAKVDYVQIDNTMNPGMSGGPMVDYCGNMVGMNTFGASGLGLAISTDTISQRWQANGEKETQDLKDVVQVKFEPDKGPADVVRAYYSYLKARNLEKAYALLSDNYPKGSSYEVYKNGFATSLDTTIVKVEPSKANENILNVKLASTDLIGDEIIYKYFEGTIEARKIDGHWKLWGAKMKEVSDPPYDWSWK